MKNNQVKILAIAIYEASKDKKSKELDTVITNFSAYLKQHYLVSMISSILVELEKIHFLNEGIVATKVASPKELDKMEIRKISDLVKTKIKQEVVVKNEKDKDLIGGVVIKYNDKVIDMSIRHQLNNLGKQLSN